MGCNCFGDRARVSCSTSSIVIICNYPVSVSLILSLIIDCKADRLFDRDATLQRHFSGGNRSNALNLTAVHQYQQRIHWSLSALTLQEVLAGFPFRQRCSVFLARWPKCHAGVTVGREAPIKDVTVDLAKAQQIDVNLIKCSFVSLHLLITSVKSKSLILLFVLAAFLIFL